MGSSSSERQPRGLSDEPQLSLVIVNWNAGNALADCLSSLERHPPSRPWDATVVDNCSSDGSVDHVRRHTPWVKLLVNDRNRGLAAANNQGIRSSRGGAIVISNPDVVYGPGSLDALCELSERRSRAAFVFARIVHPSGEVQTSAGDLPTLRQALLGRQAARRAALGEPAGFWWDGWAHDEERQIGHGLEACYLARRAAVEEIGLQDEDFFLDWEGIDWAARAREAGWEVWFCPRAEVIHAGGASIRQAEARWVVASHRGIYRYFRKRMPAAARPLLASALATRAAVKLGAVWAGARMYERAHRTTA
jgi:N-acetylglucosaminyl-diphospho-decaprenol L-rhamnosyltransferase